MQRDEERINRVRQALRDEGLDAVICADPPNVLMLSGYCPVTGTTVAIATAGGQVVVLTPSDEEKLAREGGADDVITFEAGSLADLRGAAEGIMPGLRKVAAALELGGSVGVEDRQTMTPAPYVGLHSYRENLSQMLLDAAPRASVRSATALLEQLRSVKTPGEIARIKTACTVAHEAFARGMEQLNEGISEAEAAAAFRLHLSAIDLDHHRADGSVYCMSGPNGYEAFAAYQRSRSRMLRHGDLALIHCNSHVDGFWTDITRTYVTATTPDERQRQMYEAIFEARSAALAEIRPGARAADVDRAARDVLTRHGFGDAFKHPAGHGVGFAAINHNALPRIHPKSTDVLVEGMTFNIEPGIYIEGYGGMRHCDMVAVTKNGVEVLTPFQCKL